MFVWWVAARTGNQPAGGGSVVVGPQPAHRVVHGREDLHRRLARVDALELLVDAEDAAQLAVELRPLDVRQVEVDAVAVRFEAEAPRSRRR